MLETIPLTRIQDIYNLIFNGLVLLAALAVLLPQRGTTSLWTMLFADGLVYFIGGYGQLRVGYNNPHLDYPRRIPLLRRGYWISLCGRRPFPAVRILQHHNRPGPNPGLPLFCSSGYIFP